MNADQLALMSRAKENIQGAKGLIDMKLYNIAVSRAYYAMFYLAQALLLSKSLSFSKHSAVNAAFGKHFSKTGLLPKHLHGYLLQAQEDRHVGDYDVLTDFSQQEAMEQVAHAEEFLVATEKFFGV